MQRNGLKSEAEVYASMKRNNLGKNKFNIVKTSLLNEPPLQFNWVKIKDCVITLK